MHLTRLWSHLGNPAQAIRHILAVTQPAVPTTRCQPSCLQIERPDSRPGGDYGDVNDASSIFRMHGHVAEERGRPLARLASHSLHTKTTTTLPHRRAPCERRQRVQPSRSRAPPLARAPSTSCTLSVPTRPCAYCRLYGLQLKFACAHAMEVVSHEARAVLKRMSVVAVCHMPTQRRQAYRQLSKRQRASIAHRFE